MPKEMKSPSGVIAAGRYRTRERFVVSKPDGRLRDGLFSRDGIRRNAMVWIELNERRRDVSALLEISMPWLSGGVPIATGSPDGSGWWGAAETMGADDWTRFLANLVLDESDEAWLDETCGASRHMTPSFGAVLLELLATKTITREQIAAAQAAIDARDLEES